MPIPRNIRTRQRGEQVASEAIQHYGPPNVERCEYALCKHTSDDHPLGGACNVRGCPCMSFQEPKMELPTITQWEAQGNSRYRVFGQFWADVTLKWDAANGWVATVTAGNYKGRLDGLAEAAVNAIAGPLNERGLEE